MKDEMFTGRRIDAGLLAQNLTPKQMEAYVYMRDMFDKALDAQNAARAALGKEPITAKEAYLSSRWSGDFRQPVKDADGKIVWYLAADSQRALNSQIKALKERYPNLIVDPKEGHVRKHNIPETMYDNFAIIAQDVLGKDNPLTQDIMEFLGQREMTAAEKTLGQTKHFAPKGNVRGFVGDRPGVDTFTDMVDMFQQQIQYGKNAFKWSEMQKIAKDMKDIVSNPELQDRQPNTVKYIREYYKNALGFGESELARAFENSFRKAGISPSVLQDAIGNVKSFFILQKLAMSAGYTAANMVQHPSVHC
jgi:hypothetical protein